MSTAFQMAEDRCPHIAATESCQPDSSTSASTLRRVCYCGLDLDAPIHNVCDLLFRAWPRYHFTLESPADFVISEKQQWWEDAALNYSRRFLKLSSLVLRMDISKELPWDSETFLHIKPSLSMSKNSKITSLDCSTNMRIICCVFFSAVRRTH